MIQKIIDLKVWHGRGESWMAVLLGFIKYPVYLGAFKFLFPWLPGADWEWLLLGVSMAFAKIFVGYLDFKRGMMLKEAERATEIYNPYFQKIKFKLDTIDERLKTDILLTGELLKGMAEELNKNVD